MKELIELLRYTEVNGDRDPQNYVTNLCGSCYLCEQAADALEQLEKQVQKWIPVTERLPKAYERVMVATERGDVLMDCISKRYGKWCMEHFDIDTMVTHWMPLPEPPKGE